MKIRRILGWGLLTIFAGAVVALFIGYWMSDNACSDPPTAAPGNPMKAIIYCDYGLADVLKLESVEKPVPADDEILVKVRASSVNPFDWHYIRGTPYLMRIDTGLRRPKILRLGVDYAGTVEAVGKKVTKFKPGDDVFGAKGGAFAEYVAVKEDRGIVLKPPDVSFEQGATVGIAGITALQSLRDRARLQPGQRVLINGASGGVGTFAVQIAKSLGAEVTGVCSTRNVEMVRSIGADHVVDYKNEDYTKGGQVYDVIMDNVGNRSLLENRRILKPGGKYILVGGGGPDDHRWTGPMLKVVGAFVMSWFVSQDMRMMMADSRPDDMATVGELMQSGQVKPVIDRRYGLSELPDAIRYLEEGHARGKVVITVD